MDDREIKDVIRGVQFYKEVKYLTHHPVRTCVWFIDLVDYNDNGQPDGKGFFEYKVRLGHWAFLCVNEEQRSIGHIQNPFDLTSEISMAGRVDDVDPMPVKGKRPILGGYRDTPFPLQIH